MADELSDSQILHEIKTKASVPLWPHTGRALRLKRGASDVAAEEGKIPTLDNISRLRTVPTAWIRRQLQID